LPAGFVSVISVMGNKFKMQRLPLGKSQAPLLYAPVFEQ